MPASETCCKWWYPSWASAFTYGTILLLSTIQCVSRRRASLECCWCCEALSEWSDWWIYNSWLQICSNFYVLEKEVIALNLKTVLLLTILTVFVLDVLGVLMFLIFILNVVYLCLFIHLFIHNNYKAHYMSAIPNQRRWRQSLGGQLSAK